MVDYLAGPVVHEAFFKKYASKKFLKGMSYTPSLDVISVTNTLLASIVLRSWAKQYVMDYGNPLAADAETPSSQE